MNTESGINFGTTIENEKLNDNYETTIPYSMCNFWSCHFCAR
jgi:hypothetical protein